MSFWLSRNNGRSLHGAASLPQTANCKRYVCLDALSTLYFESSVEYKSPGFSGRGVCQYSWWFKTGRSDCGNKSALTVGKFAIALHPGRPHDKLMLHTYLVSTRVVHGPWPYGPDFMIYEVLLDVNANTRESAEAKWTAREVLQVARVHLSQFDPVNAIMALHRVSCLLLLAMLSDLVFFTSSDANIIILSAMEPRSSRC